MKLSGTDHRVTSAYHPQSNGLCEQLNQTLQNIQLKRVNDNQDDWDELFTCSTVCNMYFQTEINTVLYLSNDVWQV